MTRDQLLPRLKAQLAEQNAATSRLAEAVERANNLRAALRVFEKGKAPKHLMEDLAKARLELQAAIADADATMARAELVILNSSRFLAN